MDHKLRAVLEQIESSGELRDFGSSKYGKTALVTRASRRGLIVWSRRRARYELTTAGRKRLARARAGKGTWSISAKAAKAIGITMAAGVLGAIVFYTGAFHQMFRGPTSASVTMPPGAEAELIATLEQVVRAEPPIRSAAAPDAPAAAAPPTAAPQAVGAAPDAGASAIPSAAAEKPAAPSAASPGSPPVATAPRDPATGPRKRHHADRHYRKRHDWHSAHWRYAFTAHRRSVFRGRDTMNPGAP
jgi:hypothetical protein